MSFLKNHKGYPEVPLVEIATLKRGYDLPIQNRADGNVPILAANGQNGTHNEAKAFGPGVVTGRSGTIGKVHYIEGYYWPLNTSLYVTDFHGNHPKWVFYMLQAFKLDRFVEGAGVPTLNRNLFHDEKIPLPPLTEQKRIAAILDKADSLRRKNQQAIQLADQFLRALFLELFGDPVTNPKGWEVKKLKEISHIQIGPFGTQLHKEDYIEGGIPLINPTHIVNGKIVSNMNYTIPSNKHAELDEYHLKASDIIMGRRGEMGRCAVVTEHETGWLCGTGSLFIRTYNTGVFSEYLCTLLSGKTIKSYLEAESQGAIMPNLNKTIVGNINIPVPSEDVLKKYSTIQEKTMKNINKMGCFSGELLFNSLSQKAFAGEL